jgi:hypothetical protein
MCVKAVGGTKGASQAFETLEARLPSLKGRRFYGTYSPFTGEYRACVRIEGEDPKSMGFDDWTIPGGKYARQRVLDWSSKVGELPQIFEKLASGRAVDKSRPSIEFYRSDRELIIYFPVLE